MLLWSAYVDQFWRMCHFLWCLLSFLYLWHIFTASYKVFSAAAVVVTWSWIITAHYPSTCFFHWTKLQTISSIILCDQKQFKNVTTNLILKMLKKSCFTCCSQKAVERLHMQQNLAAGLLTTSRRCFMFHLFQLLCAAWLFLLESLELYKLILISVNSAAVT